MEIPVGPSRVSVVGRGVLNPNWKIGKRNRWGQKMPFFWVSLSKPCTWPFGVCKSLEDKDLLLREVIELLQTAISMALAGPSKITFFDPKSQGGTNRVFFVHAVSTSKPSLPDFGFVLP